MSVSAVIFSKSNFYSVKEAKTLGCFLETNFKSTNLYTRGINFYISRAGLFPVDHADQLIFLYSCDFECFTSIYGK